MKLLAELRRRNVIRMAGLYLVGAWLITQVTGTVLPMFDAPAWLPRSIVILLAIGFVPALVIAWVFELTPDGLKRDADVPAEQSVAPQTARRMDRTIIVVLLLALGYFALDKFVLPSRQQATAAVATNPAMTNAATAADSAIVRGVAVLPFDNLSPDPDNAFFAGGIHEEVLTKLSRLANLRVISRTSMERIAEEKLDVKAIGQRLGVSHVMEGSVRRAGNQVRVTVQLIEAGTDNHVWAETYDRSLEDVFAIQTEIALAIADQLKISLSPQLQSNLGERPTQNPAAYDLYLRAIEERRTWRGATGARARIALLEPAVSMDPDFLRARVHLAEAYGRMYWLGEDPDNQYVTKARALTADIAKRWPDHPESVLAQAQLHYTADRNYEAALRGFRAVEAALPGDLVAVSSISGSLKRLRRTEDFLAAARRWQSLDPESPLAIGEVVFALVANHRYDEAITLAEQAAQKFPEDEASAYNLAVRKLLYRQDLDAMLDYGRRPNASSHFSSGDLVSLARFVAGDMDGALAVRATRPSDNPITSAMLDARQADLLRLAGRSAEAQALAERAFAVISAAIAEGRPAPRGQVAAWYARAAATAALAGDRDQADAWESKARATPLSSQEEAPLFDASLADLQRFRGDPEAAWQLAARTFGDSIGLDAPGVLFALKPYYDQLYGQSPSYRAYMTKLAGERR